MTEDEKEEEVSRRVRRVSKTMAFVFVGWFVIQFLGAQLKLPDILLPILDLIALFAFIWALIEIWNISKIIRSK